MPREKSSGCPSVYQPWALYLIRSQIKTSIFSNEFEDASHWWEWSQIVSCYPHCKLLFCTDLTLWWDAKFRFSYWNEISWPCSRKSFWITLSSLWIEVEHAHLNFLMFTSSTFRLKHFTNLACWKRMQYFTWLLWQFKYLFW